MKLVEYVSIMLILSLFALSSLLALFALHNPAYALIFGFVNILGATFPPTKTLIDAHNPFVLLSILFGIIGNIALTIFLASLLYGFLSNISLEEFWAKQQIKSLKDHVIISPINGLSLEFASLLKKNGIKYVLIDTNRAKVREAIRSGHLALWGDAAQQNVLKLANLNAALALLPLYDYDIKNVFVTTAAKSANPQCRIISRIGRIEDIPKLENAGARRIILPEAAVGKEIADFIISKY